MPVSITKWACEFCRQEHSTVKAAELCEAGCRKGFETVNLFLPDNLKEFLRVRGIRVHTICDHYWPIVDGDGRDTRMKGSIVREDALRKFTNIYSLSYVSYASGLMFAAKITVTDPRGLRETCESDLEFGDTELIEKLNPEYTEPKSPAKPVPPKKKAPVKTVVTKDDSSEEPVPATKADPIKAKKNAEQPPEGQGDLSDDGLGADDDDNPLDVPATPFGATQRDALREMKRNEE